MQTVKDHIKSDILQSAATLFLEKGYLKVPMREIAHKSGVGLSNIYNYFSCKDDIFVQIVTPAVRTFENMLDEHHGRRGTDIMVRQGLLQIYGGRIHFVHPSASRLAATVAFPLARLFLGKLQRRVCTEVDGTGQRIFHTHET